ncbi:unnamed protein product, partial [Prorocentrum cordatum]
PGQRPEMEVDALRRGVRRLDFDEAMPAVPPHPPPTRWHCPVAGCPCADPARHQGWANAQGLHRHLDAHVSGQLAGQVDPEWFRRHGRARCRVCGLSVGANRGVHPACRPADRAALRMAAAPQPVHAAAGRGVGEGRPSLASVHAASVPTLRYVPKRAPAAWSRALTRCLAGVVAHNSVAAVTDLQMLAKTFLSVPPRTGRDHESALAAFTLERLARWEAGERQAPAEPLGHLDSLLAAPELAPNAVLKALRAFPKGGFRLLGAPIGDQVFTEAFTERRATKVGPTLAALETLHPQVALLLLRHCASFGKLVYCARTAPPELQAGAFRSFDAAQRAALGGLLAADLTDAQWHQASRGLAHAGLGLRRLEARAAGAYLASLGATRRLCSELDPAHSWAPEDAGTRAGAALSAHNAQLPQSAGLRPGALETAKQKDLSAALDDCWHRHFLENLGAADRADIQSELLPGAPGFLEVAPNEKLGLLFEPEEFLTELRRRILLPVYDADHFCPCCDEPCDRHERHAGLCAGAGGRVCRRNASRNLVGRFAAAAGCNPELERPGLLPPRPGDDRAIGRRPADVYIPSWHLISCACQFNSDEGALKLLERQLDRCGPEHLCPKCLTCPSWPAPTPCPPHWPTGLGGFVAGVASTALLGHCVRRCGGRAGASARAARVPSQGSALELGGAPQALPAAGAAPQALARRGSAMATLPPEAFAFVQYDDPADNRPWHERLIMGWISGAEHVVMTPDGGVFIEQLDSANRDLSGVRLCRFAAQPAGADLAALLAEGASHARVERRARGLAQPRGAGAAGGPGGAAPVAAPAPLPAAPPPAAPGAPPPPPPAPRLAPVGGCWVFAVPGATHAVGQEFMYPAGALDFGGRAFVTVGGDIATGSFVAADVDLDVWAAERQLFLTRGDARMEIRLKGPPSMGDTVSALQVRSPGGFMASRERWLVESRVPARPILPALAAPALGSAGRRPVSLRGALDSGAAHAPSHFQELLAEPEVPEGRQLYCACADIQCAFYQRGDVGDLCQYFCLPKVSRAEALRAGIPVKYPNDSSDFVDPAMQETRDRIVAQFEAEVFAVHDISEASSEGVFLGADVGGLGLSTRRSLKKLLVVRKALFWLASGPYVSGRQLELILGHYVAACLFCRPGFAVMRAVYEFARSTYDKPRVLWKSCRYECWVMAVLCIHLQSPLSLPWASEVVATDASTSGMGVTEASVPRDVFAQAGRPAAVEPLRRPAAAAGKGALRPRLQAALAAFVEFVGQPAETLDELEVQVPSVLDMFMHAGCAKGDADYLVASAEDALPMATGSAISGLLSLGERDTAPQVLATCSAFIRPGALRKVLVRDLLQPTRAGGAMATWSLLLAPTSARPLAPFAEGANPPRFLTKTGTSDEAVPLDNPLWLGPLLALRDHGRQGHELLFTTTGIEMAVLFRRVTEAQGLQDVCLCQLRRGGASEDAPSARRALAEVKTRRHWSQGSSVKRYAKLGMVQQLLSALSPAARAHGEVQWTRLQADPFGKVKQMIKELITRLMEEASDEAEHKSWCDTELSTNEQTRKEKTAQVEALHAEKDQLESSIAKLASEVAKLTEEIAELDAAMAEATELRTAEKAKNEETIDEAQQAQKAVAKALVILKEFYAKAAEATALVQQEPLGRLEPPRNPDIPEMYKSSYQGMGGEAGGVVGMLEVIETDFARLEA